MRRRALVLGVPSALLADDRSDALETLEPLTSALSEGDKVGVERVIPKDQQELRTNLTALVTRTEVTSSVAVISADATSAEVDWYIEIRNKTTQVMTERRRGRVKLQRRGRKIVSLEPASFFLPPAE